MYGITACMHCRPHLDQQTNLNHNPFIFAPVIESRLIQADSCRIVKRIRGDVKWIPVVLFATKTYKNR